MAISPDGTLVYAPPSARSGGNLVWVDREGRSEPITTESQEYSAPTLSPDGTQVAYWFSSGGGSDLDIWVHDIPLGRSTRLTFGGFNAYPVWSHAGNELYHMSNQEGGFGIFKTAADGSHGSELVYKSTTANLVMSLMPDDASGLLYEVNPVTNRDIWSIRFGEDPEPLVVTPYNERAPILSPDGEWFAYVSDETGRDEVYVRRYPDTGGRWMVSTDGGREPRWARDGSELFYRAGDRLLAVRVESEGGFRAGRPEELFRGAFMADNFGNPAYDVTADGQRFVMVQGQSSNQNHLFVVLNWFEELNELAPRE